MRTLLGWTQQKELIDEINFTWAFESSNCWSSIEGELLWLLSLLDWAGLGGGGAPWEDEGDAPVVMLWIWVWMMFSRFWATEKKIEHYYMYYFNILSISVRLRLCL